MIILPSARPQDKGPRLREPADHSMSPAPAMAMQIRAAMRCHSNNARNEPNGLVLN